MEYKYQEIMEHIEVSPEMRERILRKLQNIHPVRFTTRTLRMWVPLAAAACLILVIGAVQFRQTLSPRLPDEESFSSVGAGMPGEEIRANLGELSALAGFPIPDIADAIPFSVEETRFSMLWDDLAQAVYAGTEGREISFRVSAGTEDNSGVYEDYSDVEEWSVGNASVTVKGNDGQYALAVWTTETMSYSIYAVPFQPEEVWRNLISAAVENP